MAATHCDPPQPPPLFNGTAASVVATIQDVFARHRAVLDGIVAEVTPATATFATVLRPILVSENDADTKKWVCGFYQLASPEAALRDASREVEELIDEFDIECDTREDLFALMHAAYESRHDQGLDGESLHLLEKEWRRCVRNGMLLPAGPGRDRFKEAQKEISRLCLSAQKVLDEDTGGVWFAPEELDGIPQDDVDIGELEQGTGENTGKVKVTFKYDHMLPLYKNAVHEATRRKYMLAVVNRVGYYVGLLRDTLLTSIGQ